LVNVTLSRLNSNVFQDNFGARGTSFLNLRRSRRPQKALGSPSSVLGRPYVDLISTVRDRVCMTAAMLVLEPIGKFPPIHV
jgi:hypothetical protein